MKPLRILFLSDTGGQMGGATISLALLIDRLDRSQFEPYALLGSDGDFADTLRRKDVDVTVNELKPVVRSYNPLTLLRNVVRLIRGYRAVAKVCREKQIDAIHANDNTVAFFAVLPARRLNAKAVWHVRSPIRRLGWIGGFLVRRSDAIVSCSEATLEPFRAEQPQHADRMFVAYDGVDAPHLTERSRQPSVRSEFNVPDDVPLIGVVSRISESKGQDIFLRAAVVVSELHPKARFVVAGGPVSGSVEGLEADIEFENRLRQLAEKLNISDKVMFAGYRHDIPAVMKDLSVVVVASRREPLGLVALEAMALGVPVVASNVDGLRESIINEQNGLLVPPEAAGAMGMAIARLLKDRTLARRLAHEGRRTVATKFTADAHAASITDIYIVMMSKQP